MTAIANPFIAATSSLSIIQMPIWYTRYLVAQNSFNEGVFHAAQMFKNECCTSCMGQGLSSMSSTAVRVGMLV